ncbi:MAG: GTPase Era, partial [Actinomycetota bacterium]
QVEVLTDLIAARMPEGPALYPVEMVTDSEEAQRISEIVREKAMVVMREEVPHSIAVTVEEMGPGRSENVTAIFASIYVERDSQKGMVIGRQGAVLAQIGTDARPELEALLGTKVYLDLRVKISKEWQRDPKKLDKLGY